MYKTLIKSIFITDCIYSHRGYAVVQLVEPLRYKSECRGFDSFRPHYGPGVDSASNRNEYQDYFLGVEAASPEPSTSEVELAFDELKSHKSPGIDQIPAELIKAGSRTICLEIHKLITSLWKKEKLPEEWKESIIVPIHKKGDKTDRNNYRGISLLQATLKCYPTSCSHG